MNTYLTLRGLLLLLAGRLGDLVGRTRVFVVGLATFTAARWPAARGHRRAAAGRAVPAGLGGALARPSSWADRPAVPGAGRAGEGDGGYSFVSPRAASIGLIVGGSITQLPAGTGRSDQRADRAGRTAGIEALLPAGRGTGLGRAPTTWWRAGHRGLSLGIYAIVRTATHLGPGRDARRGGPWRWPCSPASWSARPGPPGRCWLCASSAPAGQRGNLVVVLLVAAGFGFQFLTALYLQRVPARLADHRLAFLPARC